MHRPSNDRDTRQVWFLLALVIVIGLALMVQLIVVSAVRSETCLTTTVQPQHVLGNFDGDTFTVSLGALGSVKIRVQDIDTPERTKKQPGWEAAKNFTASWLVAAPFELATCFDLTLGRVVGVASREGETLADALRKAGLEKIHHRDGALEE